MSFFVFSYWGDSFSLCRHLCSLIFLSFFCFIVCLCTGEGLHVMTHVSCMCLPECLCVSRWESRCVLIGGKQQVDVSDRLNYSNQSLLTPRVSAMLTALLLHHFSASSYPSTPFYSVCFFIPSYPNIPVFPSLIISLLFLLLFLFLGESCWIPVFWQFICSSYFCACTKLL